MSGLTVYFKHEYIAATRHARIARCNPANPGFILLPGNSIRLRLTWVNAINLWLRDQMIT